MRIDGVDALIEPAEEHVVETNLVAITEGGTPPGIAVSRAPVGADHLDGAETKSRPLDEIVLPLLRRGEEGTVPGRVGKPEERGAITLSEVTAARGYVRWAVHIERILALIARAGELTRSAVQPAVGVFATVGGVGPDTLFIRAKAHPPGCRAVPETGGQPPASRRRAQFEFQAYLLRSPPRRDLALEVPLPASPQMNRHW